MKFFKTAFLFGIFFLLFWIFPVETYALAKFSTTYQIYYLVDSSGKTHVKFIINQTNNLSVVYATNFGLSINGTNLDNIKVFDEGVLVVADVIKSLNQTSISFPFTNKVVGKDKVHSFTIEYDTNDISTKNGNTWQVDIPRLEPDENITEQTVILQVPDNFPAPTYIDPKPDIANNDVYYFSGSKISNKPISAIFGKTQFYKGKLTYHLLGSPNETTHTDIALPPETSYQSIFFQNIDPKPESIKRNDDGNLLASYKLAPKQKLDVHVDLIAKIDFLPKPTNTQPSDALLAKTSIWNFDSSVFNSPDIRSLKTPKAIYDFTVDKLKYDYGKLNRKPTGRIPASESLINYQSAICTDFADTFISIARKNGFYARELEGYAISENPDLKPLSLTQDVLHAWPEYFDKARSMWVQVDPTWGNTTRGIDYFNKLDFNHIVFAIHGENQDYPIPAGGYKNGSVEKDVTFEPTDAIEFPTPDFSIKFEKQEDKFLIFKISNNAGVSFFGSIKSVNNQYLDSNEYWINISPFSSENVKFMLKKPPLLGKINSQAIIYIDGKQYSAGYSAASATSQAVFFSGFGGILAILAFGSWHLHIRRRKQKTPLYR